MCSVFERACFKSGCTLQTGRRTEMKREALRNCIWLLSLPSHFSPSLFFLPLIFSLPTPSSLPWKLRSYWQHPAFNPACSYPPPNPSCIAGASCSILSSSLSLTCHASLLGGKNKHNYWNPVAKLLSCNPCLKCGLNQSAVTSSSCKSTHTPVGFVSRSPKGPAAASNKSKSSDQHQL